MIVPVAGSTPPQKLSGSSRTSALPWAVPGSSGRAWAVQVVAGGNASAIEHLKLAAYHASSHRRLDTVGERSVNHLNLEVCRRVPRPLGRVGHHRRATAR